MKKRCFKRFLAGVVVCVMVLACVPMTAFAAGREHKVAQMGEVEAHVFADDVGGPGQYNLFLNLNGYKPQTVSSVIKGDFTENDIRKAVDTSGITLPGVAPLIADVVFRNAVVSDWESMINVQNGGVRSYRRNVYSSRDLTSITYSLMQPGDQPAGGLYIAGCKYGVVDAKKTTHYIYMDGQLFFEATILENGIFASYKFHAANFQTKPAGAVNVVPASTKVYVDGRQVSAEAYSIGGSNYMRLRDVAYLLKDTQKKFGIETRNNGNVIDVIPGVSYRPVGGELSKLPSGQATVSQAQIVCDYEVEGSTHPDSLPYEIPYVDLETVQRMGPLGTMTRYIVTYREFFAPIGYTIGGNNFYRVSDIAHIAGFRVDSAGDIRITTVG